MTSKNKVPALTWPAPAKINLFLHITGRQPDGYHDLQTLFQILDWGDELTFSITRDGHISRSCNIEGIAEKDDICVKAASLLKSTSGISEGVHIDLTKNIPMGSGLGGGSSDAATTLVVLNHLWSCGLTTAQLAALGLELGADVPVFVYGQSALAQGRGELLHPVNLGKRYYLLVFPGLSISTARVFQHPELQRNSTPLRLDDSRLTPGRNDCMNVVMNLYPELKAVVKDMQSWGEPHMSGTGSTFFLQFDSKNAAINAASNLKCRYNVRPVRGVDRSPLLDRLLAVS